MLPPSPQGSVHAITAVSGAADVEENRSILPPPAAGSTALLVNAGCDPEGNTSEDDPEGNMSQDETIRSLLALNDSARVEALVRCLEAVHSSRPEEEMANAWLEMWPR